MSLASPHPSGLTGKPGVSLWGQAALRMALCLILYVACYLLTAYGPDGLDWLSALEVVAYVAAIVSLNVWSWRAAPAGPEDMSAYIVRRTLSVIGGPFTLLFTLSAWMMGALFHMNHMRHLQHP